MSGRGDHLLCPIRPDTSTVRESTNRGGGHREEEEGLAEAIEHEEEGMENPAEEAKGCRPAKNPRAPTQAERDAHDATHLPFRDWCPECVKGRRDNPAHASKVPEDENALPEVQMDYCFVRREGETDTLTVLIMKDRQSRAIRTWVMRHKGVDTDEPI